MPHYILTHAEEPSPIHLCSRSTLCSNESSPRVCVSLHSHITFERLFPTTLLRGAKDVAATLKTGVTTASVAALAADATRGTALLRCCQGGHAYSRRRHRLQCRPCSCRQSYCRQRCHYARRRVCFPHGRAWHMLLASPLPPTQFEHSRRQILPATSSTF